MCDQTGSQNRTCGTIHLTMLLYHIDVNLSRFYANFVLDWSRFLEASPFYNAFTYITLIFMCALLRRKKPIMANYIINMNKDEKGLNEVHTTTCSHRPNPVNQDNLGYHSNEIEAVEYAKQHGYPNADGCLYCCPLAHHG